MCLDIKWYAIRKTAKKDIIVYKCLDLSQRTSEVGVYVTPFRRSTIEIGQAYQSTLSVEKYYKCRAVEIGIHSLKSLKMQNIYNKNITMPQLQNVLFQKVVNITKVNGVVPNLLHRRILNI
jgi:hypothetical protein